MKVLVIALFACIVVIQAKPRGPIGNALNHFAQHFGYGKEDHAGAGHAGAGHSEAGHAEGYEHGRRTEGVAGEYDKNHQHEAGHAGAGQHGAGAVGGYEHGHRTEDATGEYEHQHRGHTQVPNIHQDFDREHVAEAHHDASGHNTAGYAKHEGASSVGGSFHAGADAH